MKRSDLRSKKPSLEQIKNIEALVNNIYSSHKKLQDYLSGIGLEPVGGWRDPKDYKLIAGLNILNDDEECDECSIVEFPDDCVTECDECDECDECTGVVEFPDDCVTESSILASLDRAIQIKSIKPVEFSVQPITQDKNTLNIVLKRKK